MTKGVSWHFHQSIQEELAEAEHTPEDDAVSQREGFELIDAQDRSILRPKVRPEPSTRT